MNSNPGLPFFSDSKTPTSLLVVASNRHGALREQLDSTVLELDATKKKCDDKDKLLEGTTAELEDTNNKLESTTAKLEDTDKKLAATMAQLDDANKQLMEFHDHGNFHEELTEKISEVTDESTGGFQNGVSSVSFWQKATNAICDIVIISAHSEITSFF